MSDKHKHSLCEEDFYIDLISFEMSPVSVITFSTTSSKKH
jgi:hypothetical protein